MLIVTETMINYVIYYLIAITVKLNYPLGLYIMWTPIHFLYFLISSLTEGQHVP